MHNLQNSYFVRLCNFKEEVFTETVKLLHKKGYVSLEKYYVDGTKENSSGYKQTIDVYQCKDCDGCPLRSECTKAKQGRTVQRNEKWLSQKVQVNELFEDAEYKAIAKRRSIECETVFGQIKGNQKFRRFLLRGKKSRDGMGLITDRVQYKDHDMD